MRWFWIDRFREFEPGVRATSVKNVSLSEEHLHDHFPGFPTMPGSLMIEGMAQTGGILLGHKHDFRLPVVLAKVPKAVFFDPVIPGDTIVYQVEVTQDGPEGGLVCGTASVAGKTVMEAEIMFAYIAEGSSEAGAAARQKNFVFESGLLDILAVGNPPAEASS